MTDWAKWTDAMDAKLLAARDQDKPMGWAKVVLLLPGIGRGEAEKRYRYLKGASPEDLSPLANRDGLAWLIGKKRLTPERARQAQRYRDAFRNGAGVAMKSSAATWTSTGGGTPGSRDGHDTALCGSVAASRDLFVMRWQVLKGQAEMLIVMDAVCGIGHTLRDLAGGQWQRAGELEAVLKVALDLLHADQYGVAQKVA
jgi:hypothetical protein